MVGLVVVVIVVELDLRCVDFLLRTEKDNYVYGYFIYFQFALLVMARHLVWLSLILQCGICGQNSDELCWAVMYYLSIVEPQVSQKA